MNIIKSKDKFFLSNMTLVVIVAAELTNPFASAVMYCLTDWLAGDGVVVCTANYR